ncbi:MAG: ribbon-helix-helix protein, CopG family [Trueperaceae bacterium]|nr:ribbon-helix-helix protein, CopG family [Trueperaceae bacterium]
MKTAISLPDDVYRDADRLAKSMGLSRSELYATAVREFLARHRHADVTSRLNELYAREQSGLASNLREAQAGSVGADDW